MSFLKVENIKAGYQSGFFLNNISVAIKEASFSGIIGPNGSGKTTFFKAITREIPLLQGKIVLQGEDITNISAKQIARKIAVVSQHLDVADISVEEYVIMGRLPYRKSFQFFDSKEDIKIAEEFMTMVGVHKYKDKQISELSGGEQQLAALARALTQKPKILLLDEPTSHLDIAHQIKILNLLQNLNTKYNLSILMIIHDLNLAAEYCDNVIMFKFGNIYASGSPNAVINYQNIESVFETPVITLENPLSKKPAVFPLSQKILK